MKKILNNGLFKLFKPVIGLMVSGLAIGVGILTPNTGFGIGITAIFTLIAVIMKDPIPYIDELTAIGILGFKVFAMMNAKSKVKKQIKDEVRKQTPVSAPRVQPPRANPEQPPTDMGLDWQNSKE